MRVFAVLILFSFFAVIFTGAAYSIPQVINFQAKLTNTTNNLLTGNYNFTFRIYNSASGSSLLWSENKILYTSSGYVSTILGSSNPIALSFDQD